MTTSYLLLEHGRDELLLMMLMCITMLKNLISVLVSVQYIIRRYKECKDYHSLVLVAMAIVVVVIGSLVVCFWFV